METTFVAAFPGLLLYTIDCTKTIIEFKKGNEDKYVIELQQPENWKDQHFLFTFSKEFKKGAYKGYKSKGEDEYRRAKSIEQIFTNTYEARFFHNGLLSVKVIIPDDWDYNKKQLAQNEALFQFCHVAKTLFTTLQKMERMEFVEFKKLYTYLGTDGVEGLARKLVHEIKENFEEYLGENHIQLEAFRESLGTTSLFPFTVLFKYKAFKTLISHRDIFTEKYGNTIQRKFAFLFRRLSNVEKSMFMPLGSIEECLAICRIFADGLNNIKEKFSFQLGITSTFYEVIGLTIALSSYVWTITPSLFSIFMIPLIGGIFLTELLLLLLYSTGSTIREELLVLISESRRS